MWLKVLVAEQACFRVHTQLRVLRRGKSSGSQACSSSTGKKIMKLLARPKVGRYQLEKDREAVNDPPSARESRKTEQCGGGNYFPTLFLHVLGSSMIFV